MSSLFKAIRNFSGQESIISIQKPYIQFCDGNYNQAVVLSQLVFWSGKGANEDGWIYKAHDELAGELYLSVDQVRYAIKKLKSRLGDILQTSVRKVGGTPMSHYKLDGEALMKLILPELSAVPNGNGKITESTRENSQNHGNGKIPESNREDSQVLGNGKITESLPLHRSEHIRTNRSLSEQAKEIISHLNDNNQKLADELGKSRSRGFTQSETNLKNVIGRLKEFSAEDCKLVLDYLHQRWGHDSVMREYLTVTTIFRKSKFEERLVAATSWQENGRPQYRNDRWQSCVDETEQRRTQAALAGLLKKAR